ncbi:prepilin-type N-terminal cleavage/methylation domain-containing protein [Coraliomargarita sp. SDUM461004]|uniref:Prepilin-type N-terminal cleavage/methylation domain-containing protein n=1 Tax=Thalassobacterium sedimentorum TaxID=3041258 RepID=A0ABU1AJG0_9BACT|nr:prepilin-type N-terminal cleavage/methylation domain-containing protein [Coraliomargarita sp. SDUM461004]MDQ8194779.1 prepilin-type N-terminal cleavage/methylation domain-containing protein [Coraliomargarita sp. SDUM461004]
MREQRQNRTEGDAFTLIELLAVIAVIAVLMAILIPVVGSIRSRAESMECVSNLKSIGQAALLYSAAHQNNLVPLRMDPVGDPAGFWYDHLYEYVDREPGRAGRYVGGVKQEDPTFLCPTVGRRYVINRICGWNGHGDKGIMPWYIKMGQGFVENETIQLPGDLSRTAWFADPMESGDGYFLPENYNATNNNFIGFPHSDSCNVLFMDGHVENIPNPDFVNNPSLLSERKWVGFFGKNP